MNVRRVIILSIIAILCAALVFTSCASVKSVKRGILSAETMRAGGRLYHASRISSVFEYVNLDSAKGEAKPLVPCGVSGCLHDSDACPAYIRGLTCWVADNATYSGDLFYAQTRSYIDPATHKSARHNVIARLNPATGETATLLTDWEYAIDQLLLYDNSIYFLSKNADGLHDVWQISENGGVPSIFVRNDGVDITMLGMENLAFFVQNKDGDVFRRDDGNMTRITGCEYNRGVYICDKYIYYPEKNKTTAEYEYLPGRTMPDPNGGEPLDVAVAVNACEYYRIPANWLTSSEVMTEFVTSGVQATDGGYIEGGKLYLPAWDFKYIGSKPSDGAYNDYFSRTGGAIAVVDLETLRTETLLTGADCDFTEIYAVTVDYIVGRASSPLSAYADGVKNDEKIVVYNRKDGSVRTVLSVW